MRTALLGACLTLVSSAALAQDKPAFEVASIRAVDDPSAVRIGFQATGSQVRIAGMSVKDLLIVAYGIKPQQIEGPDWIGQLRFSVTATIPEGVPGSKVPEMLQTLLADRFQVKQHHQMQRRANSDGAVSRREHAALARDAAQVRHLIKAAKTN